MKCKTQYYANINHDFFAINLTQIFNTRYAPAVLQNDGVSKVSKRLTVHSRKPFV